MVLVDQDKDVKISRAVTYVAGEFILAKLDLVEELNIESKFDAAWVASRDASAKGHVSNGIQMLRWLFDNLVVTVPAAYSDGEVDTIDNGIRQKDDGT